ncbi:hypothetical protein V8G54_001121 [Vigna mungo]|uniref:Uncharacterized protein n=1 Tax=Vigna mungo TaxID=3915 RepID=A0AAQ3S9M8_VIGMU
MTDTRGAPAETQNNSGFFMLTCLAPRRKSKKQMAITIVCQDHSSMLLKTELITGTRAILLVKCVIPRRPFSCCRPTITADPPMNPIRIAFDRKSMINPSLRIPRAD